jgi:hypothetical protein
MTTENRAEIVKFSGKLRNILTRKYKKRFTKEVFKTVSPNPYISIGLKDWKNEIIPNDLRVQVAKAMGWNPLDWSNVSYGNIRDTYITLHYDEWKTVLNYMGEKL